MPRLTPSAILVHQLKNTFSNSEELTAGFDNSACGEKLLAGHTFKTGLRLVEVTEGAFEISDREGRIGHRLPLRDG